jgi:H+-translocating NAD(P) transhydrogenase subunit alpha
MTNNTASLAKHANELAKSSQQMSEHASELAAKVNSLVIETASHSGGVDPLIFAITIFVLACFVGYYVVWKVTPALHTPLMAVTNAISGIIIVGAIIALGPKEFGIAQVSGFIAVMLAAVNIFGGFVVTQRMLSMFKKK